jgi:hypothetical protein
LEIRSEYSILKLKGKESSGLQRIAAALVLKEEFLYEKADVAIVYAFGFLRFGFCRG